MDGVISIALFFLTTIAYWPVIFCDFIPSFDDAVYVLGNPHLRDGFTWQQLNWIFLSFSPDNWFPITRLSLILDYRLFGLQAGWYHAENVLIHAAATVLLFGFLRRATGDRWPSLFVACVFALHPMHVESVAWISERKDVLCALFWFATLWAWLRYTERPSHRRYAAVLVWFAAGIMSKPMMVTLPFLLFLLDFWPLKRRMSWKVVAEKVPLAVLAGGVMLLTYLAQRSAGAMVAASPLGLRIENALITVPIYIFRTLWPARLSAIYGFPQSIPLWQAIGAAAGIAVVSIAAIRGIGKRPFLFTGWFLFLLTLAPVIGVVQVGVQARADRYMYVPMTGLAIMLAWSSMEASVRWPGTLRWIGVAGASACVSMGALTAHQAQYWKNSETLFQHSVQVAPDDYMAWDSLGQALALNHRFSPEVISCFRTALRLRPDYAQTHNNLAVMLARVGKNNEALAEYSETLRLNPAYFIAHQNLAGFLRDNGNRQEAINEFETVIALHPSSVGAHRELGILLVVTGQLYEGIAHLQQAVQLEPDDAPSQVSLGSALQYAPGHDADALMHFREALRVNAMNADAHLGIASSLMRMGKGRDEAIAHLEAAQRIRPTAEVQKQLEDIRKAAAGGRAQ